jgi:hypothetical protein
MQILMQSFGIVFVILYFCIVIGVTIFVLTLMSRFVKSSERIAGALEEAARNLRPQPK